MPPPYASTLIRLLMTRSLCCLPSFRNHLQERETNQLCLCIGFISCAASDMSRACIQSRKTS